MAPTYGQMWPKYKQQWDAMQIKASRTAEVERAVKRQLPGKARYQWVESKTGVPWPLILAIHIREGDGSWSTQLAQGDPLGRKSTHVPRGMGPYFGATAWERAAIEALEHDKLDKVKDWVLEKMLFHAELFNGWGYHNRGKPSPYVWGATNIQQAGKYVADGVWSSSAWDSQIGVAAILAMVAKLDSSVVYTREWGDGPAPNIRTISTLDLVSTPTPTKPKWKFWRWLS